MLSPVVSSIKTPNVRLGLVFKMKFMCKALGMFANPDFDIGRGDEIVFVGTDSVSLVSEEILSILSFGVFNQWIKLFVPASLVVAAL